MKKTYITPAALTVEVKAQNIMQASIGQISVDFNEESSIMETKALMWSTWTAESED